MKLALRKLFLLLASCTAVAALAAPPTQTGATFSTLVATDLVIEGLTTDNAGNLYAPGRGAVDGRCPVYRVAIANPVPVTVGYIVAAGCSPSGLAFGPDGKLYVTQGANIYRFVPNPATPPDAEVFAVGVLGTNGVAFDRDGNLWTGDGTQGNGRVWKIAPNGNVQLMFRVQPMANAAGIGRSNQTLQPPAAPSPQPLVANGLAFTSSGDLLIADTARGAIWKVGIARNGAVEASMGCDTTFTPDTLCLDNVFVAHPLLDGADGFVLDVAGNMWVSANERNAVIYVSSQGEVVEVFRNPVDAVTGRRNAGPLESPTSPVLTGTLLCTANSDGNRRDNSPNTAGEIPTATKRGKISCMDQRATVRGMELPVR